MRGTRVLQALFVAYVAATAVHIGFVVAHEPFSFDAWNVAVDTGARPFSFGRLFDYWRFEYAHSNPRLGQALTYCAYKLEWFAEICTPLAFLGATLAITMLGIGRWPRRNRELALWSVVIGFCWFALPQIGRNMFCRAYAANYIYAAAIQLSFLVPLRLGVDRPDRATPERCVSYAMFGLLAGMCNEHTGPVIVALLLGYAWWLRRTGAPARVPLAGAAGVLVGFLALFFAPGQNERYDSLAQQLSLTERLVARGVAGALDLQADYLTAAAPLLALFVLVLVFALVAARPASYRVPGVLTALALAAGVLIAAILCASPKLGSRFFIFPCALLLAAFIALVDAVVQSPRALAPLLVVAIVASLYAAVCTIPLFRTVGAQGAARMRELDATTPGSSYVAEPFAQVRESWWFIGDDFRDRRKRAMVADYFALTRVTLRGHR